MPWNFSCFCFFLGFSHPKCTSNLQVLSPGSTPILAFPMTHNRLTKSPELCLSGEAEVEFLLAGNFNSKWTTHEKQAPVFVFSWCQDAVQVRGAADHQRNRPTVRHFRSLPVFLLFFAPELNEMTGKTGTQLRLYFQTQTLPLKLVYSHYYCLYFGWEKKHQLNKKGSQKKIKRLMWQYWSLFFFPKASI